MRRWRSAVALTHTTSRDHRTIVGSPFLTEILRFWPTQNFPVSTAQFCVRATRNALSDGTRYWYVRFACLPILLFEVPPASVILEARPQSKYGPWPRSFSR